MLDPSPDNVLGKSIMAPDVEAQFIADGYVFLVALPGGGYAGSRRPIAEVFSDWRSLDADARKLKLHAVSNTVPVEAG